MFGKGLLSESEGLVSNRKRSLLVREADREVILLPTLQQLEYFIGQSKGGNELLRSSHGPFDGILIRVFIGREVGHAVDDK